MGALTPKISCGRRIEIAADEFLFSRVSTLYISCGRRKANDFFSPRLRASGLKSDFTGESADSDILARLIDFFCVVVFFGSTLIIYIVSMTNQITTRLGWGWPRHPQGAKGVPEPPLGAQGATPIFFFSFFLFFFEKIFF